MAELAGRYRLGEELGRGGTATVYRATDLSLGVERAVKLLRVDAVGMDSQRARLNAEARVMARVAHPNILRIYDVGSDEASDFVVMELATGGSLQDRLDRDGPLPPLVACRYALQVLGALAAAHDAGVIHRDVKPQNVLLDAHGVAMLADFGIALLGDGHDARQTRIGVAMGSMTYMPPEQRLDARGVGVSADVYATGATLYALLTGASPVDLFLAAPGSMRWEDVPPPLRGVLQRATRLAPDERYGSARHMAAALLEAMESLPPDATAHPEDDQGWSAVRERVLGSLSLPSPDLTTEARLAPRKAAVAGIDPTVAADAEVPPLPEHGRWVALGAALLVVLGLGGWMWRVTVAPPRSGGVISTPRPEEPGVSAVPIPEGPSDVAASATPVAPPRGEPARDPNAVRGASTDAVAPPASKPRRASATAPAAAIIARPDAPTAAGVWKGSWAGRPMRIELEGPDGALQGRVISSFMGNTITTAVRGSFDPATRRLELADLEEVDDRGRYTATLTDDPAFEGRFTREQDGRVSSFRVVPVP